MAEHERKVENLPSARRTCRDGGSSTLPADGVLTKQLQRLLSESRHQGLELVTRLTIALVSRLQPTPVSAEGCEVTQLVLAPDATISLRQRGHHGMEGCFDALEVPALSCTLGELPHVSGRPIAPGLFQEASTRRGEDSTSTKTPLSFMR